LLGAKSVSGTDMLSTYGAASNPWIEKKSGDFEKWKTSYGIHSTIWDDKVMMYSIDLKDFTTKIGLFARDKSDIAGWLKAMFLSSRKETFEHFMEVSVPVHYLDDRTPVLPLDSGYASRIFMSA
jgi:hypothetical protein